MGSTRTLSTVALAIAFGACRAPGGAEARPAPAEAAGEAKDGLRLSIAAAPSESGAERVKVTLTNSGEGDLLANIGVMLANGKEMFPAGITLECESADGKKLLLVREPSWVAGRMDPLIVPLPAGASWSVLLRPGDMMGHGPRGPERIGPGTYRVRAVLSGKPVGKEGTNRDTEGLATWRFWTGTVRSGETAIQVR